MVETQVSVPCAVRFGVYEADLRAGELRRKGRKLKLQDQPFQVLALLLERPGEVVTREALREKLWPADTFVEFDHSLNTAISKIREALGDLADNPRFVETLPRRGYRFIAPVEAVGAPGPGITPRQGLVLKARPEGPGGSVRLMIWRRAGGRVAAVALAVALAGVLAVWLRAPAPPKVVRSVQMTNTGRVAFNPGTAAFLPALVTDGTRLYFSEEAGGHSTLAQMSTAGGEVLPLRTPFEHAVLLNISPDGSEFLVATPVGYYEVESPLWAVPVLGGAPRRVGDVMAHDAAWLPDGQEIVYAHGQDLYLAKTDGSESRKFVTTPGRAFWLRWSPDSHRLRFTLVDPQDNSHSLWEVSADGTNLHRLLPGFSDAPLECCGSWTLDGQFYLFAAYREGRGDIWALREKAGLFREGGREPMRLTTGPLLYAAPVPSRDGKKVFVVGMQPRGTLLRYDLDARKLIPYLSGVLAIAFHSSWDGEWVAYATFPDGKLWRSKPDGSQRLQLTSTPMMGIWLPRWSPDGKRIAFMGKEEGKPWKIYVVSAEGGTPQQLVPGERNQADPGWSPDGQLMVFGRLPEPEAEASAPKAIHVLNLKTKQVTKLPGSDGLFSPRWSPDGRYVAAMPLDLQKVMLFDFTTRKWMELADHPAHNPTWSRDGKYIYFQGLFMRGDMDFYRVRISDHKLERIAGLKELLPANVVGCRFNGLTPDSSPVAECWFGGADIYALDWQVP